MEQEVEYVRDFVRKMWPKMTTGERIQLYLLVIASEAEGITEQTRSSLGGLTVTVLQVIRRFKESHGKL